MICCGVALFNKIFCIAVPGECKLLCLESLFVGSKSMVALSLAELPGNGSHIVLAMGGLDNKVHVYFGERTGKVCNLNIILFIFIFSCKQSFLFQSYSFFCFVGVSLCMLVT